MPTSSHTKLACVVEAEMVQIQISGYFLLIKKMKAYKHWNLLRTPKIPTLYPYDIACIVPIFYISFHISQIKVGLINNVHSISIGRFTLKTLNFVQTKGANALTCMFEYVCSYVCVVTWWYWWDMAMGNPISNNDKNKKFY